jgi:hypothetical protein
MLSRFEVNVQTGERSEIFQRVYTSEDGEIVVLDDGVTAPDGFLEFTGDPPDLPAIE